MASEFFPQLVGSVSRGIGDRLTQNLQQRAQERLSSMQAAPTISRLKGLGLNDNEAQFIAYLPQDQQLKALEFLAPQGAQLPGQEGQQLNPRQQLAAKTAKPNAKLTAELDKEAQINNEATNILDNIERVMSQGPFRTGIATNLQAKAGLLPQKYERERELYNLFQSLLALEQQSKSAGGRGSDFLRKIVESGKLSLAESPSNLKKIIKRLREEKQQGFKAIEQRRKGLPVQAINQAEKVAENKPIRTVNALKDISNVREGMKAYNTETKKWSIYNNGQWREI